MVHFRHLWLRCSEVFVVCHTWASAVRAPITVARMMEVCTIVHAVAHRFGSGAVECC